MAGIRQNRRRIAIKDDLAGIHDDDPAADACNRTEIMADIDHRLVKAHSNVAQKFEDVRLCGDIKACGRLVKQQGLRFSCQGHGDGDALLLSAGQLMRIAARDDFGIRQAHLLQQLDDTRGKGRKRQLAVQRQRFGQLGANAQIRRQRLSRVLWDQRDPATANALQLARRHGQQIAPVKQRSPGDHAQAMLEIAHHGERERALAGTALADDTNSLPAPNAKIDVAQNGQEFARATCETDAQILDINQDIARHLSAPLPVRGRCRAPWRAHPRSG